MLSFLALPRAKRFCRLDGPPSGPDSHLPHQALQRPFYLDRTIDKWLALRLDALGNSAVAIAALYGVVAHSLAIGGTSSTAVGLSLTYAFSLTSMLSMLLMSFAFAENALVSMERLHRYATLPSEPKLRSDPPEENRRLSLIGRRRSMGDQKIPTVGPSRAPLPPCATTPPSPCQDHPLSVTTLLSLLLPPSLFCPLPLIYLGESPPVPAPGPGASHAPLVPARPPAERNSDPSGRGNDRYSGPSRMAIPWGPRVQRCIDALPPGPKPRAQGPDIHSCSRPPCWHCR